MIYHNHHIIPKHMGGSYDPSNLVRLTIEEHAEAHKTLYESIHAMSNDLGIARSVCRARLRKEGTYY